MSESAVIEIEGLTKYYGDVRGVEALDLVVRSGEVFGFLGPNGAGKSTTIRLLLGLLTPSAGSIRLLGRDVSDRAALLAVKHDIGYIPGDVSFYEAITGEELLDYFGQLKGHSRRAELTERFPFPAERPIKEYSSGNRQKLAIVQAFMNDPSLVIMDEPTAGLDPLLQNEFYDLLAESQSRGATAFLSSHILSEVRRTCDRAAIIRDGRLVALEDLDELLRKGGKVVRVTLEESPDPAALEFEGVSQVTVEDGTYTLIVAGNYDDLIDRLDGFTVRDLEVRETSLEDVFIHFYGEEAGFSAVEHGDGVGGDSDSVEESRA